MSRNDSNTKFSLPSWCFSCIIGVAGVFLMILSVIWVPAGKNALMVALNKLVGMVGQTLIGSCAISLLLEISTLKKQTSQAVKEGCNQVLTTLYGDNPKYLENLSQQKNAHIRAQLAAAALNQQCNAASFTAEYIEKSALRKFENRIMDSFLKGIICYAMERKIQIEPILRNGITIYKMHISENYRLKLLSADANSAIRDHRFRFISQQQNDSFTLESMVINEVDYQNSLDKYVEKQSIINKHDYTTVGNRTFNYLVCVHLPKQGKYLSELNYQIQYNYENYEMSTYLTSSLNYPTYNINEEYSIIGQYASDYIIHGFSHFPYHSHPDKKIYFKRINSSAIHIAISNDWQLPGSGSSVVVRQRNSNSETLN